MSNFKDLKISKELFEAVMGFDDVSSYKIEMELIKWYGGCQLHINHFFFKCIDFVDRKGYIFNFDSRGYARVKHISTGNFKLWEDEEFNKQRLFDACQWVLREVNK